MKVKEAVKNIKEEQARRQLANLSIMTSDELCNEVDKIYYKELNDRIKLRSYGKSATPSIVVGVSDEMDEWVIKFGQEVGLSEERIKNIIRGHRGTVFAKHNTIDPIAQEQIDKCRMASSFGVHPLNVLTTEGLEAIGSMMLGKMIKEAKQLVDSQKLLPDKEFCPFGAEARTCQNQKALSKDIPKSVADVQFFCVVNLNQCNWAEKQSNRIERRKTQ